MTLIMVVERMSQVAGLNRAKIRDILAHRTQPWEGVTGTIALSAALDNVGDVYLAKRQDGQWRYHSREDLNLTHQDTPARNCIGVFGRPSDAPVAVHQARGR